MLKCKNNPLKKYKGNEPSPKGLGYCAGSSKLNSQRKGKDGNTWVVKSTKAGVKRWVKTPILKTLPSVNFDSKKFLKEAFLELEKNGIIALPSPFNSGGSADYAWYDAVHKIKTTKKYLTMLKKFWDITVTKPEKEYFDEGKKVPFMYYMKNHPVDMIIIYHDLTTSQSNTVKRVLRKHFGKNLKWNGTAAMAIIIKTGLKPPPKGRKVWSDDDKKQFAKWAIEYPEAKFVMKGKNRRWTSPKIEKMMRETRVIQKEMRKYGEAGRNAASQLGIDILPLTPWASPKSSESDSEFVLKFAKSTLDDLRN